jgi:hypothetical protein
MKTVEVKTYTLTVYAESNAEGTVRDERVQLDNYQEAYAALEQEIAYYGEAGYQPALPVEDAAGSESLVVLEKLDDDSDEGVRVEIRLTRRVEVVAAEELDPRDCRNYDDR